LRNSRVQSWLRGRLARLLLVGFFKLIEHLMRGVETGTRTWSMDVWADMLAIS